MAQTASVTREQLIAALNGDLAREYQAIIAYVTYSQVMKGAQYMNIAAQLVIHANQELAHALLIAQQIDYLGGVPTVTPKPVKSSKDAEVMLRADLDNEIETIGHYRTRIRQADSLGEFAMSEILRRIVTEEQDHAIDLATALGIDVPAIPVGD
ncbi:MAG TPA: ferritin-like domain-containing protein [Pirellulales bacterium]|nr:ferritin-like domain-containing protein [Pirellulales bacterium]